MDFPPILPTFYLGPPHYKKSAHAPGVHSVVLEMHIQIHVYTQQPYFAYRIVNNEGKQKEQIDLSINMHWMYYNETNANKQLRL